MIDHQSPFEQKVESIATVLDEFPPMQVIKAIEELAENPDSGISPDMVLTAATNLSEPEEIARRANNREDGRTLELVITGKDDE